MPTDPLSAFRSLFAEIASHVVASSGVTELSGGGAQPAPLQPLEGTAEGESELRTDQQRLWGKESVQLMPCPLLPTQSDSS